MGSFHALFWALPPEEQGFSNNGGFILSCRAGCLVGAGNSTSPKLGLDLESSPSSTFFHDFETLTSLCCHFCLFSGTFQSRVPEREAGVFTGFGAMAVSQYSHTNSLRVCKTNHFRFWCFQSTLLWIAFKFFIILPFQGCLFQHLPNLPPDENSSFLSLSLQPNGKNILCKNGQKWEYLISLFRFFSLFLFT